MKKRKAKVSELFIATCVGETSDRFGLPAVEGDDFTPSGLPLNDSPANAENARLWLEGLVKKFEWIAKSTAVVGEEEAGDVIELIRAAMDDDQQAIEQLREVA
jgi:hypothetical protein